MLSLLQAASQPISAGPFGIPGSSWLLQTAGPVWIFRSIHTPSSRLFLPDISCGLLSRRQVLPVSFEYVSRGLDTPDIFHPYPHPIHQDLYQYLYEYYQAQAKKTQTYKEIFEEYLDYLRVMRDLKAKTLVTYHCTYDRFVTPAFGDLCIADITELHVIKLLRDQCHK